MKRIPGTKRYELNCPICKKVFVRQRHELFVGPKKKRFCSSECNLKHNSIENKKTNFFKKRKTPEHKRKRVFATKNQNDMYVNHVLEQIEYLENLNKERID